MSLPPTEGPPPHEPHPLLGLREAVAIIVGLVVGAGIFKAPALVAGMAGSSAWMFAAWVLGGLISLAGALCYAELATAYPHAGGDYHFLRRAYGRGPSFLFAWARFAVITTGSIALLGFVFGDYMQQLLPLGRHGPAWWAATAVLVLTALNLRGLRTGAATQTWLTAVEVAGLLLVVGAGLFLLGQDGGAGAGPLPSPAAAGTAAPGGDGSDGGNGGVPAPSLAGFGLAMVFVLLTYGGWNEAAYISAEVRQQQRNMVRALVLAIAIITALYLLVVWAYWHGLGLAGMARSQGIAAELLQAAFGRAGGALIAAIVAVSALTSMNATLIVGARSSFAAGRDWPVLARLGRWDAARGTPPVALALQGAAALALVALGSAVGSGFKAMVEFTAPVFWFFFLLSGLALFVLRRREPQAERPFRVPLYPLVPLLFCATCACMLWSSLSYVYSQQLGGFNAAWVGVGVLLAGALWLPVLRAPAPAPEAAPLRRSP